MIDIEASEAKLLFSYEIRSFLAFYPWQQHIFPMLDYPCTKRKAKT